MRNILDGQLIKNLYNSRSFSIFSYDSLLHNLVSTRKHPSMTTLQVSEQLNLEGIHASLNKMPESAYRTYCNWILTQSNLTEEWLQLVGMTGLTRLTLGLLDGLLSKPE